MIDFYLLEKLVAVAKYGTLTKAAEKLNVTQPTLTRNMKKLEEQLGVSLFKRQVNKITLNQTGQYTAQKAEKLLKLQDDFKVSIQAFDHQNNKIKIASVAPGPQMLLHQKFKHLNLDWQDTLTTNETIHNNLLNEKYDIIITNKEITDSTVESYFLGKEHLQITIDSDHPITLLKNVYFKDLAKLSFIVYKEIGIWKTIIENAIPDANFLYQDNFFSFKKILNHSNFPYFITNLTPSENISQNPNRSYITLNDKLANQEFFACYLKTKKTSYQPILKEFSKIWPK